MICYSFLGTTSLAPAACLKMGCGSSGQQPASHVSLLAAPNFAIAKNLTLIILLGPIGIYPVQQSYRMGRTALYDLVGQPFFQPWL